MEPFSLIKLIHQSDKPAGVWISLLANIPQPASMSLPPL
jgi:hypothetical protein